MSEGVQFAGEFDLQEALLFSPNGQSVDLLTDMGIVSIEIFEDLFKSSISGNVLVIDTRNIISKLPIMGQERLSLKIATPTLEDKKDIIDFTENHFFIYKVRATSEISSGARIFELKFISPEAVKNTRTRVSKSFVKSKANIGEVVFDLLAEDIKGIKTSKEVIIEETTGNRGLIIANSNPFTYITRLAKEAVSKNGSPHYVFFENKNGIHFTSLQSLYDKPIRGEFHSGDKGSDEEYTGEPDAGKIPQTLKRIIEYSINTKKDLLLNSSSGMLGGKVIEHNIFSKKYNVKTFSYFDNDNFEKNKRAEQNRVYSTNVFGPVDQSLNDEITGGKIHVLPISKDSNDFDTNYEVGGTPNRQYETLLDRQSRFTELNDGISINMTIHGQTTLAVGNMVNLSLPTLGDDDDGVEDKFYSGSYLIKRLKHRFDKLGKTHTIDMEVVRDGFPERLDSGEEEISKKPPTTQPKTPDFAAF